MTPFLISLLLLITTQSSAEIFSLEPKDTYVPRDSPAKVEFVCRADVVDPIYFWRKDDVMINTTAQSRFTKYGGTLEISSPQLSDQGKYQCAVKSVDGTVVSNYGQLVFQYINAFTQGSLGTINTYAGTGVEIPCTGADYAPKNSVLFLWENLSTLDRIIQPGNSSHYISKKTGTLYIANPVLNDAGSYECSIRSNWLLNGVPVKKTSTGRNLAVKSSAAKNPPEFMLSPQNDFAVLDGYYLFECFAKGNPAPAITWSKENGALPSNHTFTPAGQLFIRRVTQEAAGTYICQASNSEGTVTASATLQLQYKPKWTTQISSLSADLSTPAVLRCSAVAEPPASYIWLKNGQVLQNTSRMSISGGSSTSDLRIHSVNDADQGMYQCVATNTQGSTFSSARLTVNSYPPTFDERVPDITKASRGRVASVVCVVSAAPPAHITWAKDNIDVAMDNVKYFMETSGTLHIRNVTSSDEGTYRCTAENMLSSISSEGSLQVFNPTVITKIPDYCDTVAGDSCQLYCEASHDLQLHLRWEWLHDGTPITRNTLHYDVSGNSLIVKDVTSAQSGIYRCCAITDVEEKCAGAKVKVVAPPDPPLNVRASLILSSQLTLSWDAPRANGANITQYRVEGRLLPELEWESMATNPVVVTTTSCSVVGLLPHNSYSFRVFAANKEGNGIASVPSQPIMTTKASPVVAPSDIGGGGGFPGELVVTWEPLERKYFGDVDVSYIIAVRRYDPGAPVHPIIDLNNTEPPTQAPGGPWLEKVEIGGVKSSTVFQVNASEIYRPYEVKIKAENSQGSGPFSNVEITHTASIAPDTAPTGFTQGKTLAYSAEISWLRMSNINGYTLGYSVSVCNEFKKECNNPAKWMNYSTVDEKPTIQLQKLKANNIYRLAAAGYNRAGMGPWSNWDFLFNTARAPPNIAPGNVQMSVLDLTLSASWDPIVSDSTILGYKVQYWLNNETHAQAVSREFQTTSATFSLPGKAEYLVWVRAYNEGGDGRPCTTFAVSTQKGTSARYGGGASSLSGSFTLVISFATLWSIFHFIE